MKFDAAAEEKKTEEATGNVSTPGEKQLGDATSGGSAPAAAAAVPRKFKVDASKLDAKAQKRPGLAYRSSKSETDKVKKDGSHPSPAKFGEIVEGVDEGDGWVRVGAYFLPMQCKGVPVLILATDDANVAPLAVAVPPQQQAWNFRPSVGTWHQRAVAFKHSEPVVAPVAEEGSASAALKEEVVHQEPQPIAEEATEWNKLPSVGTWLQAPRKVWVVAQEEQQDLVAKKVEEHAEIDAEAFEKEANVKEVQEKTEHSDDVAEQHAVAKVEAADETPTETEAPKAEMLKETQEADDTEERTEEEEIVVEAAKQLGDKLDEEAVEATPKTEVVEDATPNTEVADEAEIMKMGEPCEQEEDSAATEVLKFAEDKFEVPAEVTKSQTVTEQGKDAEVEWAQTMEK